MSSILQDVRFAIRTLGKSPAFTIPALLTLAVGLGAGTAVFSVVHGILISPLNYPQPEQLVTVREVKTEDGSLHGVAPPNLDDWRRHAKTVRLTLVSQSNIVVQMQGRPRRITALEASPDFFRILEVQPTLGSGFRGGTETSDEIVISHSFWRDHFGASEDTVGALLRTEDRDLVVVGILPRDFYFPQESDIYVPRELSPEQLTDGMRNARYMTVMGRLAEGGSLAAATQELETISRAHALNKDWSVKVQGLQEQLVQPVARTLWVLMGSVVLVLLIACSNVTHLLLSRGITRAREFALRSALGASRVRLVRQLLIEILLLFLAAGALGTVMALWVIEPLLTLAPSTLPRANDVGIDGTVTAWGLLAALVSGLMFGLLPALRLSGRRLFDALRSGSQLVGSGPGRHRQILVSAEIALSTILLVGAGLLVQSLIQLETVPLGFQPKGSTSFSLLLPESRYPSDSHRAEFVRQLRERLAGTPGLAEAGASTNLPLSGSSMTFGFRAMQSDGLQEQQFGQYHATTPGYFETLGIELLEGRFLEDHDRQDSAAVVLVNDVLAQTHWPGESAVGKRLSVVSRGGAVEREIVGVVASVQHASLTATKTAELYVPYQQDPWPFLHVVVRPGFAGSIVPELRRVVSGLDPRLPVDDVGELEDLVAAASAPARFRTLLLGLFALAALVISAIGIYGLMGFTVSQRTQEIGVRMAMGARQGSILRLVVSGGLFLAAWGTFFGLAGASLSARLIETLLFRVEASDPKTYIAAALILIAMAIVASWLPARRASRLDIVKALRAD